MKIQVTLNCECGTEIEEITGVDCDKFPTAAVHRHGRCPACGTPMMCVCEAAPEARAGYH